jgi:antitoxin PrlF
MSGAMAEPEHQLVGDRGAEFPLGQLAEVLGPPIRVLALYPLVGGLDVGPALLGLHPLTLPPEIRAALHVGAGDEVEFTVTDTGEVLLRGMTSVPADQRWFWQPDWQGGEREASEQINAGDVEVFDNVDAMFAALNE